MEMTSSRWSRWDIHIHSPGTALNDQYHNDWEGFFERLESVGSDLVALGITDYWSLATYEEFLKRRESRLPSVALVFPNIEMKLAPQTSDGRAVNLHVLVSPDDPHHIPKMKSALRLLTVEIRDRIIQCDYEHLVELGRLHADNDKLEEKSAYRAGVEQFKVDATRVIEWYRRDPWLRNNTLLAIGAGKDGLAGLRKDSSFREYHDELIKSCHIVLSGNPTDRKYYLGEGSASLDELNSRYAGRRPCLHGSDAHDVARVIKPDGDRYCWIKAAPTFDGLRQVMYEPGERVWIGPVPPPQPNPDQVITEISMRDHNGWFTSDTIPLANGMTAIIGEKGSGKTALTDLLAAGTHSWAHNENSFLHKAVRELEGTSIDVRWGTGETESITLSSPVQEGEASKVRYLSQQFVERLCAGNVLATELIEEIENVVFNHLPEASRLNCSSFHELRMKRTSSLRSERKEIRKVLSDLNARVEEIREVIRQLPDKRKSLQRKKGELKMVENSIRVAVAATDEEAVKRVNVLQVELLTLQQRTGSLNERLEKIAELRSKVMRDRSRLQTEYADYKVLLEVVGIPSSEWARFEKSFKGDVETPIADAEKRVRSELELVEGTEGDPEDKRTVFRVGLLLADARKKLKLDEQRETQVSRLQKDQARTNSEIAGLESEIQSNEKLKSETFRNVHETRMESYLRYFQLLSDEGRILEQLYAPLGKELSSRGSGEGDLSLRVQTKLDIDTWAERGEEMIDLRRAGQFSGRGELARKTSDLLRDAWAAGDTAKIRSGLEEIIDGLVEGGLKEKLKSGVTPRDIADWVFSVDHIGLEYTLEFRGQPLRVLSPGTRGIVLLILYLAVDKMDTRPLIVDQPEENLDNASVFEILVPYFREAKTRRQIIIITHNPNLVVNTDVEQVVVATAERQSSGFPRISYQSGPLEDIRQPATKIRDHVCGILEGGKDAFLKRERRYDLN